MNPYPRILADLPMIHGDETIDRPAAYRRLVTGIFKGLADLCNRAPNRDVETIIALDDARGVYVLMNYGWHPNERRQRGTTLVVRLKGAKIWIEDDWTEHGIAEALVAAGVPKEDIVLGFHPREVRLTTGFGVE